MNRFVWILIVVVVIFITGSLYLFEKPHEVEYPKQPMCPDYQRNMDYLLKATIHTTPKLPENIGGLYGMHLPIVSEDDFPLFSKKLQQVFREANRHFLFYLIIVGGQSIGSIDAPLLKASKGLRSSKTPNIKLVIVAPSTISQDTERILIERGILIQRI